MTKLCLNGIVKNEAANLPRMLASVAPFISCYAIVDTGSTDDTVKIIDEFMRDRGIPGVTDFEPFVDFSQARNRALKLARDMLGGKASSGWEWDYLLLVDADMELVVDSPLAFEGLTASCYTMLQTSGSTVYPNVRLIRHNVQSLYTGVTHECISTEGSEPIVGAKFVDHASGSNRHEKFKRDIRLLKHDLHTDRNNPRSWFYLAQSYKDAGMYESAIKAYNRRIEIGGWQEEIWHARLEIARCYRALGNEAKFLEMELDAYEARPNRIEPLYDLANYHRLRGENNTAYMFAAAGEETPLPDGEMLFVEQFPYKAGLKEEISIVGFYNPKTWQHGFDAANSLALAHDVPGGTKAQARANIYHYLKPLQEHAESFRAEKIDFMPPVPAGWNVLNPSVTNHKGELVANIRAVNYSIRPDGSYDMQGDTAIRTRNFLLWFDETWSNETWSNETMSHGLKPGRHKELIVASDFPKPSYTGVLGFEDIRLISYNGALRINACLREQNSDGWCEQFVGTVDSRTGGMVASKMAPTFRSHEKNWMPVVAPGGLCYMYNQGVLIKHDQDELRRRVYPIDVSEMRGGSQLIKFDEGYLGVVHEVLTEPGSGKRCYSHRFIWYSHDFEQVKVSRPFVFLDRGIEFAAGIALHYGDVVVSFGVKDREAWLGFLRADNVRDMIWHA